jgi:hypothetical protein
MSVVVAVALLLGAWRSGGGDGSFVPGLEHHASPSGGLHLLDGMAGDLYADRQGGAQSSAPRPHRPPLPQ